ncbi:alpha-amylase family glycosyl hydrolase [Ancylomarina sp. 16SWW S1-10-2]|uniref:alpha-amylase family glycosyl hydrolase n=1 Tax=Ancylomarina sp. 16SWW S1-10-2 TaxID=2499681 RepID=UPI0012AD7CC3|nr:alpha-amylase family glycosyl hydrolase [Ancylomarina sp. 16SWW S1-10-2]MRT93671.1 alpha-amlyase [Ancylomarina sp. 16SWW S1-10-2]
MKILKFSIFAIVLLFLSSCQTLDKKVAPKDKAFVWEGANLYFLLTDRFNNGTTDNDVNFERELPTGKLRGFEGGDIRGITAKIKDGYFTNLGINAIWFTPVTEQIHGSVDEGTGNTYAYHGYWAKDWTALDPNFGSMEDLRELVETAHANGIRIVMDAVINHTGPVTDKDPVWDADWVRTGPQCTYDNYKNTIECTLVANLPDVKTESTKEVSIPAILAEKWKAEGRYDQEMKELDAFFARTGYPRTPKYHIIKWLCDYIIEFGIDGYRSDTVKHTEESVWADFRKECEYAFALWKKNNPEKVLDNNGFYSVAEVYNYNISNKFAYDFGDRKVNYYANGFTDMINFEFKYNAQSDYETLFSKYSNLLHGDLKGYGVLNYLTSHDDGSPFDRKREKTMESATKLLLCPGTSQVYYGDETARPLLVEGAVGDANLRTCMNWEDVNSDEQTQAVLAHWQKLGQFRRNHPAVGAGIHKMISEKPYVFSRSFVQGNYSDYVVVALDLEKGEKEIPVLGFDEGTQLRDAYSGKTVKVKDSAVVLDTDFDIVLLEVL